MYVCICYSVALSQGVSHHHLLSVECQVVQVPVVDRVRKSGTGLGGFFPQYLSFLLPILILLMIPTLHFAVAGTVNPSSE